MSIPVESRIYVFGHDSPIGATLCHKLGSLGYRNVITRTPDELDLRRQADVYRFFEDELPDYVFLARLTSDSLVDNLLRPAESLYDRLMGFLNVMHAAYLYEVKKLLNIIELHGASGRALDGFDAYAAQRYREEMLEADQLMRAAITGLCDRYRRQYSCDFVSVIFDGGQFVDGPCPPGEPAGGPDDALLTPGFGAVGLAASTVAVAPRTQPLYSESPADACLFIMEHISGTGAITVSTDPRPPRLT